MSLSRPAFSLPRPTSPFIESVCNSVSISYCDDHSLFIPFTTHTVLQHVKDILSLGVTSTSVTQDTVTEIQQVLDVLEIKACVSLLSYIPCNQNDGHQDLVTVETVPSKTETPVSDPRSSKKWDSFLPSLPEEYQLFVPPEVNIWHQNSFC